MSCQEFKAQMKRQEKLFQGNLGVLNPRIPHREVQDLFGFIFPSKISLCWFFGLVFVDPQLIFLTNRWFKIFYYKNCTGIVDKRKFKILLN